MEYTSAILNTTWFIINFFGGYLKKIVISNVYHDLANKVELNAKD